MIAKTHKAYQTYKLKEYNPLKTKTETKKQTWKLWRLFSHWVSVCMSVTMDSLYITEKKKSELGQDGHLPVSVSLDLEKRGIWNDTHPHGNTTRGHTRESGWWCTQWSTQIMVHKDPHPSPCLQVASFASGEAMLDIFLSFPCSSLSHDFSLSLFIKK